MAIQNRILSCLVVALFICTSVLTAQEVLTNESVLNLHKAGLPAEIIAAKVKQAKEVAFALDTENLVALQEAGLPSEVITAMLERTTEVSAGSSPLSAHLTSDDLGISVLRTSIVTAEGNRKLRLERGQFSLAGFIYYMRFMNYAGLRANVRTQDTRPILHVESSNSLDENRYSLVKLDVDEDDNVRSLKVSQGLKSTLGTSTVGRMKPDEDWVVPWDVKQIEDNTWAVQPTEHLEPGEYGLYIQVGANAQSGGLFGFGVDAGPGSEP